MKEASSTKKGIVIGVFLSLGIIIIILSFIFAKSHFLLWNQGFDFQTELSQASGIVPGSIVTLNGIRVGNVEKIDLSPNDIRKVRIQIRVKNHLQNQIPQDSLVTLRTQGVLGDRYIEIKPGSSEKALLPGGILLAEEPQDVFDLIKANSDKANDLIQGLSDLSQLASDLKKSNKIPRILENTELLLQELRETNQETLNLIRDFHSRDQKQVNRILNDLGDTMKKINSGTGTLGALINDPQVYYQIKKIIGANQEDDFVESVFQKIEIHKQRLRKGEK